MMERLSHHNMIEYYQQHALFWDSERHHEILTTNDTTTIYYNDEIIGFFCLKTDINASFCWIKDLQLYPEWRNYGIGKWVLETIESTCRQQHLCWLRLCVFINSPALALYYRHGFVLVDENTGILRLEKQLSSSCPVNRQEK
ncbi:MULTISPECIES: GNAT family N-acetyltransferase [Dickeya]|uniref:Acetyltransferase, GNAT family n=1 Tax=Dickeya aquatica TaxID=1401087 RepID=A0A375AAF2_9GAMM|nr:MULTISPECIES: GNAT family N-acetyltransferase [Dickeya]SLM63092.1 Acetyltransferase, GNAT family [Dickeya aquatica]